MTRVLKLSLAATFVGQLAFAQSVAPPAPTPATDPSAVLTVPQKSTLTPQDMVAQASLYRASAGQTLIRIEGLAADALKDKDIIRINCTKDKAGQIKVNITIMDQDSAQLREAAARGDEGTSLHHFTRITIANQKIEVLATEAEGCVGEDLTFVGQTKVEVTYNGSPTDPNVTDPGRPTSPPERPQVASPYR